MNRLILTSPLPPSVNKYLNYKITRRGKRQFVEAYSSHETKSYKQFFIDYVKEQIEEQEWIVPEKDKLVYIEMTFYLDRKRKDPNNFIKIPVDALTEAGVYEDDDIALPIAERVYIDKINPRIEIEVYQSDSVGIFDNQDDLDKFMDHNCNLCKKNVDTCGVLKKLLENRIIPEVEDRNCLKRRPIN